MGILDKVKQASNGVMQQVQGMVNDGIEGLKDSTQILPDQQQPQPASPQQPPVSTQSLKFCPECGTGIEGMKFCPSCGFQVGAVNSAPVQPAQPQANATASDSPILEFVSHIQGKNAHVYIYPQYIEWVKEGSKVAHATKAVATLGVSLLAGKQHAGEMIPIKSISHVSTKRDGLMYTKVILTTSGGVIEMRVSHEEATKIKGLIMQLMLG